MVIVWVLVVVAVLAIGIVSFFVRRHGEASEADSSWTATDEVFNDPSTDRVMRVWVDGAGKRHYVPDKVL